MSRHSGSSRQRTHQSKQTNGNSEDVVAQVKSVITSLDDVLATRPHEWETYVPSARSAMTGLDRIHFFRDPQRLAEQIWIVQGLQDFAYHDADSGAIRDVAEWCQAAWLRILRNYPENVEALTGLASNWLQRAQATLARIHQEEGTDSSSQGSSSAGNSDRDEQMSEQVDSDDDIGSPPRDPRRQGPLYVEARGYLQPAVDFYTRAIRSADTLGSTSGSLLSSAAESQMSLGNVTGPPGDERHFTQAVRLLRRAEATSGYRLSVYMQQYLNDYGRYVS
ncbi:hypothetical protein B0J14DRAFT_365197 [Halenospora varia]|nr:hypothetical protein B0J14DRAFT_365197 [Halenospora varia]